MLTITISGPQGSGKTELAATLMRVFEDANIVATWGGPYPIAPVGNLTRLREALKGGQIKIEEKGPGATSIEDMILDVLRNNAVAVRDAIKEGLSS